MRSAVTVLLALFPLAAFAQSTGGLQAWPPVLLGSNLVANGGFETNLDGWTTTGGASRDCTEAHTGSCSLKVTELCSVPYTNTQKYPLTTKVGGSYRFEFWVKYENLGESNPIRGIRVGIESPFGSNGGGATTSVQNGTSDWKKLTLDTITLNTTSVAYASVNEYNCPTGTMWVDDVVIVEELVQPITAKLIHPSYRGYMWSDLTPSDSAIFEVVNNDGGTLESVTILDSDPGNPIVAVETIDGNGHVTVDGLTGSATIAFRIQGESTPDYPEYRIVFKNASERSTWPVSWKSPGTTSNKARFLVNGTPTFLLALYDSGLGFSSTEAGFDAIFDDWRRLDEVEGDVNGYLNYWWGEVDATSLAAMMDSLSNASHGIPLYWQTANCFGAYMGTAADGSFLNNQTYTEAISAHAVLAGGYIMDECQSPLADDMFAKTIVSREWNPKGADFCAHLNRKPTDMLLWYDVCDIMSADPYVLYGAEPAEGYPLSGVAYWTRNTRASVSDVRPFMQVIQYFKFTTSGRWPTESELRKMSYMSIVEGAQGLWYWSIGAIALGYVCDPTSAWCAERLDYWDRLKTVLAELRSHEAIFLMQDDPTRLVATNNSNIKTMVKDGYVIAYNDTNTVQEVTYTWDELVTTVDALDEGSPDRSITPSSTQWSDTFESYGTHLYEITDGGAPPDPELDIVDKLRGQPASTSVNVIWGDADLAAEVSCSAVLKDSGDQTLDTNVHATGFATRTTGFDGLTPATQYSVVVSCTDYEDATYSFTTAPAVAGTVTHPITLKPNEIMTTAAKAKVEYRLPGGGTSSVTDESCGSGCTVDLTLNRGALYEVRHQWLTSGDAVLATSRWRNVTVQ